MLEGLKRSSAARYGVLAAIGVGILAVLLWQTTGPKQIDKTWFTVDDGATWFADDAGRIAPFEKDGKQAVECRVYTCDGGKTTFVGFLVRYRPEGKAQFAALTPPDKASALAADEYAAKYDAIVQATREVKRPKTGDREWVLGSSPALGMAVMTVKCPDGGKALESVFP